MCAWTGGASESGLVGYGVVGCGMCRTQLIVECVQANANERAVFVNVGEQVSIFNRLLSIYEHLHRNAHHDMQLVVYRDHRCSCVHCVRR